MKLKINNTIWNIRWSKDGELSKTLDGQCNYQDMEIVLNNDLSNRVLKNIVIHEITHAYIFSYGELFHGKFNSEQLCEFIAFNAENIINISNKALKLLKDNKNGSSN